jgi:hypothetical protein
MKIWEACAGKGYLVEKFKKEGFDVVGTDINTGTDFLTDNSFKHWDVMVTNPPFGLKYKFLKRCYELKKPFALLLPVEVLGAGTAQELFEKYYTEVIFTRPRIGFEMPNKGWFGQAQFPTCWICYNLNIGTQIDYYDFHKDIEFIEWNKHIKRLKLDQLHEK